MSANTSRPVHSSAATTAGRRQSRRQRERAETRTTEEDMSAGSGVIWRLAHETVTDKRGAADVADRLASDTCSGEPSPANNADKSPIFDDRKAFVQPAWTSELDAVVATEAESAIEDSPTRRRNKRKMSEPRRRATDFSIRSICSSTNSDAELDDEDADDNRSTTANSSVPAKIWKPGSMFDVSQSAATTTATTTTFNFYPLNIPLIHNFQSGIGAVSSRAGAAAASTPIRPASTESSLGSCGDHDRSVHADDTSSSGGRPSSTGTRLTASKQLHAPSPSVVLALTPPDKELSHSGQRAASPPRKNYKNMTKQRRIEANARERTRVHTISAAFESLRRAVPSYSYNQRLSKLAILRIACSYILALARLADLDYSSGGAAAAGDRSDTQLSFAECVDLCTQTIQSEGRAKRRH